MLKLFIFSLTVLLSLPSLADEKGQDHPLVPRLPGYVIKAYQQKEFDIFDTNLTNDGQKDSKFHAEGKITTIDYVTADGHANPQYSGAGVIANYRNALKALGATEVNKTTHVFDRHIMKLVRNNKEIYVDVFPSGDSAITYTLTFIEPQPMVQMITANAMYDSLNRDGFIALYINFDTNKSDLKPDSEPTIKDIVELLKANPSLKLSIDGHTDNVGNASNNKTLSLERAKSVAQAIVKLGVPAERLSTQGYGQERPIADNRLEDGRSKNRRVELVKL